LSEVAVRRILADEWEELRDLRLRALAGAPDAFGTTWAEASTRPESRWQRWAAGGAAGEIDVLVVAEHEGRLYGLAGGRAGDDMPPDEVELVSMWVEPALRGTGTALRLVEAVLAWARVRGTPRVRLWVTEGNVPAIKLYERAGFSATDETAPVRAGSDLRERLMVRPRDGKVRPADERISQPER
jgi:GNAT superfamily N-acetyltransferase